MIRTDIVKSFYLYYDVHKISYCQIPDKHDGDIISTESFAIHGCYGNESVANETKDANEEYDDKKKIVFELRGANPIIAFAGVRHPERRRNHFS